MEAFVLICFYLYLCEKTQHSCESLIKVIPSLNICCKHYSCTSVLKFSQDCNSSRDTITIKRIHSVMAATSSLLTSGEPGQHFLNSFRKSKKEQKHSGSKIFCKRNKVSQGELKLLCDQIPNFLTISVVQIGNTNSLCYRETHIALHSQVSTFINIFCLNSFLLILFNKRNVLWHCQRNICYYYQNFKSNTYVAEQMPLIARIIINS